MDSGPIFELIRDFDDDELLERLRAMEGQVRPDPLEGMVSLRRIRSGSTNAIPS